MKTATMVDGVLNWKFFIFWRINCRIIIQIGDGINIECDEHGASKWYAQNRRWIFLLYNTRVHECQVVLSSHDATQNQVMITYINFYDTELRSEKLSRFKTCSHLFLENVWTDGSKFQSECHAGQRTVTWKSKTKYLICKEENIALHLQTQN